MKTNIINVLKKIDWKLWGGFFLIFLLYLPVLMLDTVPQRDVAYRYAPAAEAFARGDWMYAFHPRMQVIHPTVSGIFVYLFSVSGFAAAKLSGLFFYAIGIFPLFKLLKEVFCKKIAYWGILAYVFASRILIHACSGLRESHKQFVILLLVLGVVLVYKYRDQLKGYLTVGIACGLAVCTRNDMILFAAILFGICTVFEVHKHVFPLRSILGYLAGIVFSLPEIFVNYKITGYVILGSRFLAIYERLFQHAPVFTHVLLVSLISFVLYFLIGLPILGWLIRKKAGMIIFLSILTSGLLLLCVIILTGDIQSDNRYTLSGFFEGIYRGQFPYLLFLMLPGLLYRLCRRKMTGAEIILLCTYLLQGGLIILLILGCDKYLYISSRYLIPAVPLYFGWIGFTALLFWKIFSKIPVVSRYRLPLSWLTVAVLTTILYIDSYSPVLKYYKKGRLESIKKQMYVISDFLQKDYKGEKYWHPEFDISTYYPNYCPTVWFSDDWKICAAAYLAGGSACRYLKDAQYIVADVTKSFNFAGYEKIGEPIHGKEATVQIWRKK